VELKTDRDVKLQHYYAHFYKEIRSEFEKEIMGVSPDAQLSCPFCDTKSKRYNLEEGLRYKKQQLIYCDAL
jgi:hypothetical protein